jgi:gamma-glutamylcyclotransferase (GGCT)/AIG2-like uncharacterized protein YtfP
MKEAVPLFVYGSLMSGLMHHDQLAGAERLGEARLPDHHLVLYEGLYPALVPGQPCDAQPQQAAPTWVVGELFVVEAGHLAHLDQFEECPQLYQRIAVTLAQGTRAQAYAITRERARKYPSIVGNFREYLAGLPLRPLT